MESGHRSVSSIDRRLQARLSRGVDLNVKILVRGSRGVGKSVLLQRLEGKCPTGFGFEEHYVPTREIQVTPVHWRNRINDRVVSVEAWDVVDQGFEAGQQAEVARALSGSNIDLDVLAGIPQTSYEEKLRQVRRRGSSGASSSSFLGFGTPSAPASGSHSVAPLDSSIIDVYKDAHSCILLYDPRRPDTLDYVFDLAASAPETLPLLFIRTFQDLTDQNNTEERENWVPLARALARMEQLQSTNVDRLVDHLQISSCSKHGLIELYNYLQIPFLFAFRKQIKQQLATCDEQLACVIGDFRQGKTAPGEHIKLGGLENNIKLQNQKQQKGEHTLASYHQKPSEENLFHRTQDKKTLDDFLADSDDEEDQQHRTSRSIVQQYLLQEEGGDEDTALNKSDKEGKKKKKKKKKKKEKDWLCE